MIEMWWEQHNNRWAARLSGIGVQNTMQYATHASNLLDWIFQRLSFDSAITFTAYVTPTQHIYIVPSCHYGTAVIKDANRNDVYHQLLVYLKMMESQ